VATGMARSVRFSYSRGIVGALSHLVSLRPMHA
jgi:hypothetical protein